MPDARLRPFNADHAAVSTDWGRRSFLGQAMGLGTAALATLLAEDGLADKNDAAAKPRGEPGVLRAPHVPPRARRVIYLMQTGAPSHVDLFDYKPDLARLRGEPLPPSTWASG